MEKIIFEDLPSTNTPLNASNLNKIQENVENNINEINNKFNYSTEEKVIGTWIDGKKLYRKTFRIENIAIKNYLDISDVDTIYINEGPSFITWNENTISYPASRALFELLKTDMSIGVGAEGMDGWRGTITVEYTKTTD